MDIAIIGAGLGGLSSAALLGAAGHSVTIYETNDGPGGKMNEHATAGFRFDTGPSLLTMPGVIDTLFEQCGASRSDYLSITPVEPLCRYIYGDGTTFRCYQSAERTMQEIKQFAPDDVAPYRSFLAYAARLYERTAPAFLQNPLYDRSDFRALHLRDVLKINAFQTVAERVDQEFSSDYLRQFFKRFSTYNGSSPFQAPATLNVIPHVELSMGGYYVEGGMFELAKALASLATELGASIEYNRPVDRILVHKGRAVGIHSGGEHITADIVLSNCDATETYRHLLPSQAVSPLKKQLLNYVEPSCSGFVLLLGTDTTFSALDHHTIFFSDDYKQEFDAIFNRKVMPADPTIYIANTSSHDPDHAVPGGSNLFVLVNAPYLSDAWEWEAEQQRYGNFIIDTLEQRGLTGLTSSIRYRHHITPEDFYSQYRSNRGSIYGTSSNSKAAAFLRPKNKSRHIDGLYFAGGSTHPGGGIPLVLLSAFHATELIARYEDDEG